MDVFVQHNNFKDIYYDQSKRLFCYQYNSWVQNFCAASLEAQVIKECNEEQDGQNYV